jgi:L-malate glycosyltransferase
MRILWITNIVFPAPSSQIGMPGPVVGGWMFSLANQLLLHPEIKLAIASIYNGKETISYNLEGVIYYLLPAESGPSYQKSLEPRWQIICQEFKPDVVHIHGTEYFHALACMYACPDLSYVISIQGLLTIISRYYFGGINKSEIFSHMTFRDIFNRDSIFHGKKNFEKASNLEKLYFQECPNIIGRTTWDFVHSKILNRASNYHFCNELLRDSFYCCSKWDINKITPYTIFLSQSVYPIKGLHQVIKAVAILKSDFSHIKVRVAGKNIIRNKTFSEKIKLTGYGSYILSLIRKYNLGDIVSFVGNLNEEQMVKEYLNAHLFICPSIIENSPNSLGEAQLLGVPSIAAYAGGIPDMITHEKTGLLYRFEEVEILAHSIRRIFEDNVLALKLSEEGKIVASERHDRIKNTENMISIYKKVVVQKS